MPNLITTGGRDREPGREPQSHPIQALQDKNLLRHRLINDGLLYYWATDPSFWHPYNASAKEALDRRLSLVTPLIQDLDRVELTTREIAKFWESYDILSQYRTQRFDFGSTKWALVNSPSEKQLRIVKEDPHFREKVILFDPFSFTNRGSLPVVQISLIDANENLLQINEHPSFPHTAVTIFSRLTTLYPNARALEKQSH